MSFSEAECQPGLHCCEEIVNTPEEEEGECRVRNRTAMLTNTISEELQVKVETYIRPLAEKWIGGALTLSKVYGFRRYLRDSFMKLHVDKIRTYGGRRTEDTVPGL